MSMSGQFDVRETQALSLALAAIDARSADQPGLLGEWDAIEEQIRKAEDRGLQRKPVEVRTRFLDRMFPAVIGEIEQTFGKSSDEGWKLWLTTLADAITMFRFDFCTRLCERSFLFPESTKRAFEDLKKAVRCMRQSRWPEAYEQLDYLAGQDFLSVVTRARLSVIMGQIQLFYFQKAKAANEFFDRAELLTPDDPKVISSLGDYWKQEKSAEKAASIYKRAIEMAPGSPVG